MMATSDTVAGILRAALLSLIVSTFGTCTSSWAQETAPSCWAKLPSAQALSMTPRDDESVELLAVSLSDAVVADEAIYARLKKDIAAMRAKYPRLRTISYRGKDDGRTLLLSVTPEAAARLTSERDDAFNCLNARLGLKSVGMITETMLRVELKGIYDLRRLASLYGDIGGVISAAPDEQLLDGSTISVTPDRDTWHYVFERAEGDCIAGCSHRQLFYTRTTSHGRTGGTLQEWDAAASSAAPAWVKKYSSRRK